MPFDDRTFPSHEAASLRRHRRQVALWLFCVAAMIFGMVSLGGATRLTGSGLSIMEWSPLAGALPPLSHAEWDRLFGLYRQIPQYHLLHEGMSLAGFQNIFWLEWAHRALGRLMAVMFILPLIAFAVTGRLERRLIPRLLLLFVLGGLQGGVGWFMVASGFRPDSTAVEPIRLVLHLTLALSLFSAVLWTALSSLQPIATSIPGARLLRRMTLAATALVCLTIVAGGFMAGLHAGLTYNTFPLMDGRLFPAGYAALHPFVANLAANIPAVQFDHRLLATLTAIAIMTTLGIGARVPLSREARLALSAMATALVLQYGLGIATLLSVVAFPLAAAHQAIGVLLLASALTLAHTLRGAR